MKYRIDIRLSQETTLVLFYVFQLCIIISIFISLVVSNRLLSRPIFHTDEMPSFNKKNSAKQSAEAMRRFSYRSELLAQVLTRMVLVLLLS